jgi:hypothetical protein
MQEKIKMNFKEITINDKALFDKYLHLHNSQISELTFTNLFMWRGYYKFKYLEIEGLLCLISTPQDIRPYALMPIGKIDNGNFQRALLGLKEYFSENRWALQFRKITKNELEHFKPYINSDEDIELDRDNSDYLYLAEELIALRGKKFHAKKNHINKFRKTYQYEYIRLDSSLLDECRRIMEEWCAVRDCDCERGDNCERYANLELLNNYDVLECKGALIKVNGRFEAFTVGEMLNNDTAVIHIEKAKSDIRGLYTFVNQQFCENEWKDAVYINREQDLGQEGLRKAKLSYNPIKIIDKYTVNLVL